MSAQDLVIGPAGEASAQESAELATLRERIMGLEGVDRIYPPASVPSKIARLVGSAASSVREAVEDVLPSQEQETLLITNESAEPAETQPLPEEKAHPLPASELSTVTVRIGTSAGANVPDTVREVAGLIRSVLSEDVAVKVDVVHI